MSSSGLPLEAFLVVDNSFLVMLTEYYHATRTAGLPAAQIISAVGNCLCGQLELLKKLTIDGCLHCSRQGVAEYKPWNSRRLAPLHLPFHDKQELARTITDQLQQATVEQEDILILRYQPDAPSRLVSAGRLSDTDLSLVAVAISLIDQGGPTYLLTNDQDLLDFVSWLRVKPEARELWPAIGRLQSLHSLTFLELVHRSCRITTDEIKRLLNFGIEEHYRRSELAGTNKGQFILGQLLEVYGGIIQSTAMKAAIKAGAAT